MSREENLALSTEAFEAFQSGDAAGLMEMLHPEIEVFSSRNLANSGSFHGHDGYMEWLTNWLEAWDDFKVEVTGTEAAGERHVLTRVRQTAVGKVSGVPVEMDLTFMSEIGSGGAITAIHLYPEQDKAREVASKRESDDPGFRGD
jgi:ketosteroid isomerase-like protein